MTEEERKAKDAQRKREAYARRKQAKAGAIANPESIPPGVLYQDHREQVQAVISEVEERHRRVALIMANYRKDAANANNLLWHILETLTLMRLELTDLIGSLRK